MDLRQQHWDNIHLIQDPETKKTQKTPYTSLNMISHFALPGDAPIIDVGGGNSHFVRELIRDGYKDLTFLDISEVAIAKKKEELGRHSLNITWKRGDVLDFRSDRKYKLWHDRGPFHFLTRREEVKKYVENVRRHLDLEGYLIVSAFTEAGPEHHEGLAVARYTRNKLMETFSDGFRMTREFEEPRAAWYNEPYNVVVAAFKRIY